MKVLVLSTMYPNSVMYLSGVFVHEQVKELIKLGLNVIVVAPVPFSPFPINKLTQKWNLYGKIPKREIIEGVEVYHPRYIAIPRGILKDFWGNFLAFSILKIIKSSKAFKNIDIIHAHGSLPDDHAAQILSQKLNVPYIITVHGSTVNYLYTKREFYRSKQAILDANAVVGVSNKVVKKLKEITGRSNNVFRILNGYNQVTIIDSSTVNSKNLKILFAGNLIESKGCEYLLKAFSILKNEFPEVQLIIAGNGVLLNKLKRLSSELKLDNNIIFTGYVEHQRMLELMSLCDIFILPSFNEGFGIVYLEAMSFKKPVIGTQGEGITDIIRDGENGFLVEPQNVQSIVQKLRLLLTSPDLRQELGIKGYETIKDLTWQKNAIETLKIYELICNRKTYKKSDGLTN